MVSLIELADRCEAAEGADRELDHGVYQALVAAGALEPLNIIEAIPAFTASLDAAMTLFPEGYFPVLDADPRGIEVEVQCLTDETDNGLGACVATGGKTIALALCAAALRARDAQKEGQ